MTFASNYRITWKHGGAVLAALKSATPEYHEAERKFPRYGVAQDPKRDPSLDAADAQYRRNKREAGTA